jgi:hypothetical protein
LERAGRPWTSIQGVRRNHAVPEGGSTRYSRKTVKVDSVFQDKLNVVKTLKTYAILLAGRIRQRRDSSYPLMEKL